MNNPIRSFNNHFKNLGGIEDYVKKSSVEDQFCCPCCNRNFVPSECEVLSREPYYLLFCPECDAKLQQTPENVLIVCMQEGLEQNIRSNDLDYDEYTDTFFKKADDMEIQIQDRECNTRQAYTTKDKWGNTQISKIDSTPKVSSHSWGRIWKDGDMVYQTEGPKYSVRQDMVNWLDNQDAQYPLDESLSKDDLYKSLVKVLVDNGYKLCPQLKDYAGNALELLMFDDNIVNSDKSSDEIAKEWFENTKSNYPEDLELLPIKEQLEEAHHYGGAYDIEDDQYFTREELLELADAVIDGLKENAPDVDYEIIDIHINDNKLVLCISDGENEVCVTKPLDLRKIRIPSDLISKYAPQFINAFLESTEGYVELEESMSLNEADEEDDLDIMSFAGDDEGIDQNAETSDELGLDADSEEEDDSEEEPIDSGKQKELFGKCKDVYEHALETILDGANADVPKNVKKLFSDLNGSVFFKTKSSSFFSFEGKIKGYSISGSIALKDLERDAKRLAEDITMATYRLNGGKGFTTPQLIQTILGMNKYEKDDSLTESKKNPGCYTITFFHNDDTCTGLMFAKDEQTARANFAKWLPDCQIDRIIPGHVMWDCYTLSPDFEEQVGWKDDTEEEFI